MSNEPFLTSLHKLVPKYVDSAPRYTSYPTAVEFSTEFSKRDWFASLEQGQPDAALSLYFHLPFCHSLCYFCACHKVITKDYSVVEPYIRALLAEVDSYSRILAKDVAVEQIHWGGGTPNFLNQRDMTRLMEHTREKFPNLLSDAEISVEVDPRTTTREQLRTLNELGFSRISLGVQDFNPTVQESINRIQPFEMTKQLVDSARDHGFSGVNIDLIYGLPNQTVAGFMESIAQVISLRPDRVALYGYAHVTWLKKVQKVLERSHLPTPNERIEIFIAAIEMFHDAGYLHIGMDHFALPEDSLAKALDSGALNRNFMGYTTHSGATVLGFGASAISMSQGAFAQNTKDVLAYQRQIGEGGFAIERGLIRSRDDQLRGAVIESLLCSTTLNFSSFNQRWECDFLNYFSKELVALDKFVTDGLITITQSDLILTELGRIFARNIAAVFDVYLIGHQAKATPVFSRTV